MKKHIFLLLCFLIMLSLSGCNHLGFLSKAISFQDECKFLHDYLLTKENILATTISETEATLIPVCKIYQSDLFTSTQTQQIIDMVNKNSIDSFGMVFYSYDETDIIELIPYPFKTTFEKKLMLSFTSIILPFSKIHSLAYALDLDPILYYPNPQSLYIEDIYSFNHQTFLLLSFINDLNTKVRIDCLIV